VMVAGGRDILAVVLVVAIVAAGALAADPEVAGIIGAVAARTAVAQTIEITAITITVSVEETARPRRARLGRQVCPSFFRRAPRELV
jgi:hypothetical protein